MFLNICTHFIVYIDCPWCVGTIPTTIGNMDPVKYMIFYNSPMSGTAIMYLYSSAVNYAFTGPLTWCVLYMHCYPLGTIPTEVGKLTKLVYLYFYYTQLTGNLGCVCVFNYKFAYISLTRSSPKHFHPITYEYIMITYVYI